MLLLLLSTSLFSQDQKLPPAPVLPFQQNALQPAADEPLAMQLYQNREYEKAAEIFEQLYEKKPSPYLLQYLIICLIETREYDKAERLVKKSMRAEPDALRYQVDLGYINFRQGNADKAKKIYDEALKKLGANQQQVFDLANAFVIRGENEYAIRAYLRGRQLVNYPFSFELASVYERMGDFRNAMEEYLNLLDVNAAYLPTIQDRIQMQLSYDIENQKNEAIRKILLARVQKYPERTVYAELLWWYSIQQKDFDLALIQAKSLDRRLGENGDKLVSLAGLAVPNGQYDVAIDCYRYLVAKGPSGKYFDYSRRELLNTRYAKITSEPLPPRKDLQELVAEITSELSRSGETPENINLIRNLAHVEAFYLGRNDEAIGRLEKAIEMPGVNMSDRDRCKIELGDILLFTGDVWQATLLYQQAYQDFKQDVLGQEAKFKNAMLSFYIGEFKWAQAQADVLKAATAKFISNDAIALSLLISENYDPDSNTVALGMYSRAALFDFRNAEDQALLSLDSINRQFNDHPILQQVLYKRAEIRRKQGLYAESDSLFRELVREFPDGILADEALMQCAVLNETKLGDREKAMTLYLELMDKFPGSIYVPDARRKYRVLRGDHTS